MIEYLLEENKVLKEQFEATGKKLRLNNHLRRGLAKRGTISAERSPTCISSDPLLLLAPAGDPEKRHRRMREEEGSQ